MTDDDELPTPAARLGLFFLRALFLLLLGVFRWCFVPSFVL
jgi:hypothetical protein